MDRRRLLDLPMPLADHPVVGRRLAVRHRWGPLLLGHRYAAGVAITLVWVVATAYGIHQILTAGRGRGAVQESEEYKCKRCCS